MPAAERRALLILVNLTRVASTGSCETASASVVQASPPRSGSTLVYNLIKAICEGCSVHKAHPHPDTWSAPKGAKVVVTVRHPLDSIVSLALTNLSAPPAEPVALRRTLNQLPPHVWSRHAAGYMRVGGAWLLRRTRHWQLPPVAATYDAGRVLVLRYEQALMHGLGRATSELESFLGCRLRPGHAAAIERALSVDAVEAQIGRTFPSGKGHTFFDVDPATKWHANKLF